MNKKQKLADLEKEAERLRNEILLADLETESAQLKAENKRLSKLLAAEKNKKLSASAEAIIKRLEGAITEQNKTIIDLMRDNKKLMDEIDAKTATYYKNCYDYHEQIQKLTGPH